MAFIRSSHGIDGMALADGMGNWGVVVRERNIRCVGDDPYCTYVHLS